MTDEIARARVVVTGAFGQFGWHMRCRLFVDNRVSATSLGRAEFNDPAKLADACSHADVLIHLAGANRGDDQEVATQNRDISDRLVRALEKSDKSPHIVYASSVHTFGDSVYGRAKREAGETLKDWAAAANARYTELIFPHLFGEHARPFYNSAVSTICYQIANCQEPTVNASGVVELLHFSDACDKVLSAVREPWLGQQRVNGRIIGVPELAAIIKSFDDLYRRQSAVPELYDLLHLKLFNTYRSYLYPSHCPMTPATRSDDRGDFVDFVKTVDGGKTTVSRTRPGTVQGQHFHFHTFQRCLVVKGSARIEVRRMLTGDRHHFDVNGHTPQFIDIPTLHAHNITNSGPDDLFTILWTNESPDSELPDTFAEPV